LVTFQERLLKGLGEGIFFNPKMIGLKRVRTVVSKWLDEYTEDKTVRHLFSRFARKANIPSPRYFAVRMGSLGWWTPEVVYKKYIEGYVDKLEKLKADILKKLGDPFFYNKFKEICGERGLNAEELLRSIRISLPARKIEIKWVNDPQMEEVLKVYKSVVDRAITEIATDLRILLTRGVLGRKKRIAKLSEEFSWLTLINVANFREELIVDLGKAFNSIRDLNKNDFPYDLEKHLNETMPASTKKEIFELLKTAKNVGYWRLK
jgi:hypothetical protein